MKFYYDESNNIRVLRIKNTGFNTDAHENPSPCFLLAGVALPDSGVVMDESQAEFLNKKINLPKNSDEMKFKNIASGGFLDNLKSEKLKSVLTWIKDSDYLIHYSNLNMEYWAVLDIIDDLCDYADSIGALNYAPAGGRYNYTQYHKDALYLLLKVRKTSFIAALRDCDYPNVTGRKVTKLIKEFKKLCKQVASPAARIRLKLSKEDNLKLKSLYELFDVCSNAYKLELVYDKNTGVLIDGLQVFYRYRLEQYPGSIHIYDNEFKIEEHFKSMKNYDPVLSAANYHFVDSKDYYEIQISDVISGLFKNYFTFINDICVDEIIGIKDSMNSLQKQNFELIKELILKTDQVDHKMLHYVSSVSELIKHTEFMFSKKI